jgi:hypothetical protein
MVAVSLRRAHQPSGSHPGPHARQKSIDLWLIDAFTDTAFAGNPAGVCFLAAPMPEPWMQSVALEMNQAGDRVSGPAPGRIRSPLVHAHRE